MNDFQSRKEAEIRKGYYIQQTAEGYDMSYDEVDRIYELYHETGEFYEKLEEFIEERANRNN